MCRLPLAAAEAPAWLAEVAGLVVGAAVVAVCFRTVYGTSLAGVSVSLGAFPAGLLVSESRFDRQAKGEILPLQIVFSALFLVSIGMLLDLGFLLDNPPAVLGAIVAVLAVKAITAGVATRALGESVGAAAASALLLAQVGEFSFVLERAGADVGLSPAGLGADGSQGLIAAAVPLLVATPWVAQAGVHYDVAPEQNEERMFSLRAPAAVHAVETRPRLTRTVVDTERLVDPDARPHVAGARTPVPSAPACEECLRSGTQWVHLRLCMDCGHVGCCDSSPNRHARRHWDATGHPIRSAEPDERWGHCFPDDLRLEPVRSPA